jgi:hypothetical protein
MRRVWIFLVVCLTMASGVATAAQLTVSPHASNKPDAHAGKNKQSRRAKHARKSHKKSAMTSAYGTSRRYGGGTELFGDAALETYVDSNGGGRGQAFSYTSPTSGTASSIQVYVDSHTNASKMVAAIYSDSSGNPGTRLATGTVGQPARGAWDTVTFSGVSITSGTKYWIAILGTGGSLYFRDKQTGTCTTQISQSPNLSSLPTTWSNGGVWTNAFCPASVYVAGTVSVPTGTTTTTTTPPPPPPPPAAPVNTAPPQVTGTTTQGNALSTTSGTWSGTPTSYSYQWRDCDASGANCTNISGATATGYTLASTDVGHTLRAVVTATNAGGNTSASSAATAVVAAPAPVAPANTALPQVTGTTTQGNALSTTSGTWSGTPTSYSYQWQDCDSSGANCTNISGATTSAYTLASTDVSHTLRAIVTATNAGGNTSASSAATAVVAAPSSGGTSGVLFGDQTVETKTDSNPAGDPQAFAVPNTATGTAQSIAVYLDPTSAATSLSMGLYADNGGHPGTLLASGTLSSPAAGAWNSVSIPATSVSPGTYWLAVLGFGGTPYWRDRAAGNCASEVSAQVNVSALPSAWATGQAWNNSNCPISAYVSSASAAGGGTVGGGGGGTGPGATAPAVTTAPSVSGTAQQGQTLTTSNGSWSGTTPMTYTYQWQQDGATNIAGATSGTYTAQASDVGHTLDAVVTATNSVGSATSASNSTGAVTAAPTTGGGGTPTGLPAGVTLQPIDGGVNYFSKWSNVPAAWSTPNFFPISAWDTAFPATGNATEVAAYKNEGVNGFLNLAAGYTPTLLNQLAANGQWFINWEGGLNSSVPQAAQMVGHFWADEADGIGHCGDMPSAAAFGETVPCTNTSDGRTPPSAIAQATADYHGAHGAGDPSRFVYGQYTKPVSMDQFMTSSTASAYENGVDVISYDHYIINDTYNPGSLWQQYDETQNVRSQDNYTKPVWTFIEAPAPFASSQWSGVVATPGMIVAEAWNAIIAGARGIEYFDADFCGSACGYTGGPSTMVLSSTNSGYAALQAAIKSFDGELTTLAPIVNDPFANGYVQSSVTNANTMNVMAKYDQSSNQYYVFSAPRFNTTETATYTVAGGYTGPVTVYGEGRTLQATNGKFSDTVAGQTAVHIYQIP